MPIYEFYCERCDTIYNFFSLRVDVSSRPGCPRCGRPELERCASRFAVGRSGKDGETPNQPDLGGLEGANLEKVMRLLQNEAGALDQENPDPRQAGRLMRGMYEAAGMETPPGMLEALRRLEAGEDPESIEAELGDAIDAETLDDAAILAKTGRPKQKRPARDETLYDL